MKETGIIMSGNHPRLILDGTKTMTRRVITPSTSEVGEGKVDWSKFCWDGSQIYRDTCIHGHTEEHKAPLPFVDGRASEHYPYEHQYLHVPYNWREDMTIYRIYPRWEVGDRLWVRETFCQVCYKNDDFEDVCYKEDLEKEGHTDCPGLKYTPSLFMPRWASRVTLEITEVRVERLQEITADDVILEGIDRVGSSLVISPDNPSGSYLIGAYRDLWDSLNAKRGYGWESNPWVWVIKFGTIGVRLK